MVIAIVVVFRPRLPVFAPEQWVAVSYAALIDPSEITQSGETVGQMRGRVTQDSSAYAQLQPFVEPAAKLLPDALNLVRTPKGPPSRDITGAFPLGSARPAWVDLLRGGRFIVTYDGADRVTVFAPGGHSKEAYEAAYGVLRHPLGMAQACAGQAIQVEVYAYENNYASFELRLNTTPYAFTSASFGPPAGRTALDLEAFDAFFAADHDLVGARIDTEDGLVLVGGTGTPATLAGAPVTVSDLAVAYRAVFHAGHNQAFVSLDPSPDPKNVRVNFGGALEDTRLGQVVLQSDMRFKTLSSGLDPVTSADVRGRTRIQVARFMTVAERDLASGIDNKSGWEGTRFWFYPDAVQIQSDLEGRTAYVERARFTADAERSRDDFSNAGEFDVLKKTRLSPSIRSNIDDLNAHYQDYAEVFPELLELGTVARLMGICSWLREARVGSVDLDGLLAAELPAVTTPRDKPQMLTVSLLTYTGSGTPSASSVLARTEVTRIDPLLGQPVSAVFPSERSRAAFLAATNSGADMSGASFAPAGLCRDFIRTPKDLQAFAEMVADRVMSTASPPTGGVDRQLAASNAQLEQMEHELERIRDLMATSTAAHNRYLDRHNDLVDRYNALRDQHNALVRWANGLHSRTAVVTTIEGGIDLAPKQFKVTRVAVSPEIERVRIAAPQPNSGGWSRSPRPLNRVGLRAPQLAWRWAIPVSGDRSVAPADSGSDLGGNKFWAAGTGGSGGWKQRVALASGSVVERVYDADTKELRIAAFDSGRPQSYLVAKRDASGRIAFERRAPDALHPISSGAPGWR